MKKICTLITFILIAVLVSVGISENVDVNHCSLEELINQYSLEELLTLQDKIEARIYELRIQDAIENGDRKIEFSENEIVIYNGQTQKLDVTVVPRIETAPKNTKLVWSSSDDSIATVTNGTIKGINAGDVIISATAQDNEFIMSSITVHVRNSVNSLKLAEPTITLLIGDSEEKSKAFLETVILPENAYDKTLTMSSSDEKVVTVSETGELQAVSAGKAVITVTTKDESLKQPKVAKCTVTVLQAVQELTVEPSLTVNKAQSSKVNPVILPDNASNKKLTYTSSDPSIVNVTETGALTAKACGSCDITCETTDGTELKAVCHVTVIQMVSNLRLSGNTNLVISVGSSTRIDATISPQDATNKKLNWTSSNSNVAKVENGRITAVNGGDCTITCSTTDGSEKKATISVHVPSLAGSTSLSIVKLNADYNGIIQPTEHIIHYYGKGNLTVKSSNTKLFKCELGNIDGNEVILKVTPKRAGSGKITITDSNDSNSKLVIDVSISSNAVYDEIKQGSTVYLSNGQTINIKSVSFVPKVTHKMYEIGKLYEWEASYGKTYMLIKATNGNRTGSNLLGKKTVTLWYSFDGGSTDNLVGFPTTYNSYYPMFFQSDNTDYIRNGSSIEMMYFAEVSESKKNSKDIWIYVHDSSHNTIGVCYFKESN